MKFKIGDTVFHKTKDFIHKGTVTEVTQKDSAKSKVMLWAQEPYSHYMTSFSREFVIKREGPGRYGRKMFKEGELVLLKCLLTERV